MSGLSSVEFHPELARAARFMPRSPITPWNIGFVRWMSYLQERRTPDDVEVLTLPSGVGIRLHRPPAGGDRGGAMLWIHGGGYLIGSPAQDDALCRRFAQELGITVAAVKYRLAPENPYPSGLEDCYTALQWLTGLPSVDPARVAVGGSSAGGGLSAALAQLAYDRGEIPLAAQLLVYPMIDDRSGSQPGLDHPGHRLWTQKSNRFGWRAYLGGADPDVAVPGRRADLSGLPPAWVGVGTLDVFHNEDVEYAERLRTAGVPCELEVVPGAYHGFDGVAAKTQVAQAFFASQVKFLRPMVNPAVVG
ncbi:alpha/beta hydrolase [Mycobacterium sp. CBMA293]|uniref:alpha/beta hydrolase n=1 Tax=unclassified Mycolicibacterium TaxID=2636767 RepID=UPI0012DDFA31|nr:MULTISPECIES: alpha/beta hydrolase [unclassified Mycolicibacterium]MUL47392.1 alpha/beta hydrolase [Mycolicibacterium sp. CBMA 360]MUL59377.1 alpha/beta hydrolase [Mycolicibacterium sp. CBMA 335]MUL71102.1 alpha/beta hydrolase [Mycolicibacterium sp. CBMA 311]MUL94745.1 alpha/beta hydrolase [Mycolicibacterium sp. CBMA 230]MUM09074.1 alpha/beta hydrolase [Mycolicibacterium sp. CBMA 213]